MHSMFSQGAVWIAAVCAGVLFLIFFKEKLKILLGLVRRAVLGTALIAGCNLAFAYLSLSPFVGINPVTITVCALLGLPGVGLLYLLSLF